MPSVVIGSVRAHAGEYDLRFQARGGAVPCGFQDGQHGHCAAEVEQSAACGGDALVVAGARSEEVAQFLVGSAEPAGRSGTLYAPHGPVSSFEAAVVRFQPIVPVAAGPVPHPLAQLRA